MELCGVLQHAVSQEALAYLQSQTDAQGRSLEVIKLPVPPPLSISAEEAKVSMQWLKISIWTVHCIDAVADSQVLCCTSSCC